MRIDMMSMPKPEGMKPEQAIEVLYKYCYDTGLQVMRLSNELEDLKAKVARLERNG